MASVGQQLTAPETGWKRFEETDNNIQYTAAWAKGVTSSGPYSGGTCTYTSTLGAAVKFNFTGSKLRIIGRVSSPYSNNITVYIDGLEIGSFSQEGTTKNQILNFEKLGLSLGEHSVQIVNNVAAYFLFDAIDIDDSGELKPPSTVIAPTNLVATAASSKVTLSWDLLSGSPSYIVKRSTISGGPYVVIASDVLTNGYVDNDVENGMTYYYVVTAVVDGVESSISNEAYATPVADQVGQSILKVILTDSSEREYRISNEELSRFVTWMDRPANVGTSFFIFNKVITESKEYLLFDKIISFEVIPLAE